MKLLAFADAGVHSGFGTVTHSILERLVSEHGWDVSVLAANWNGDHVDTNLKMYLPTQKIREDVYGFSRILEVLGKVKPDAVWMVNDPAVILSHLFRNEWDPQHVLVNGIMLGNEPYKPPIVAYIPIDGYDTPRSWDKLLPRVTRVAMTKFGRDTAMPEAPVVWHGVDRDVFKVRDRAECKRALGFDPDKFLIVRVDKNSIRKDYASTWQALRPVLRKYPDIQVHFHCRQDARDGYNLWGVTWNDEDIRDRLTFSPLPDGFRGWGLEQLAMLYSAADLFVSTSWGEGFGLTLLEAMSSGTPVIAGDHSAITEVVGDGGVLIPPRDRLIMPEGQSMCLPDIEGFSREIEHLYLAGGVRRKLGSQAVAQAARFSWGFAAQKMDAILREQVSLRKDTEEAERAVLVGSGPAVSSQG